MENIKIETIKIDHFYDYTIDKKINEVILKNLNDNYIFCRQSEKAINHYGVIILFLTFYHRDYLLSLKKDGIFDILNKIQF